jgi:hypothetical protein
MNYTGQEVMIKDKSYKFSTIVVQGFERNPQALDSECFCFPHLEAHHLIKI